MLWDQLRWDVYYAVMHCIVITYRTLLCTLHSNALQYAVWVVLWVQLLWDVCILHCDVCYVGVYCTVMYTAL